MSKHDSPVAVVTGAASGIGRATAFRLKQEGYELVLIDVDASGLAETCKQIKEQGGAAHGLEVDLRDAHMVGSFARTIAVDIGRPVLLVNAAGVGVAATVLETSDEDWERVLAVNLTGPFLTTRAILPLMVDAGRGVIVNVASVAGQVGLARRAAYCASKAGLVGLTRAVAVDHAKEGIRCVAVCPGTVATEPDDVAAVIAFVASQEGQFINGTAVIVDGGLTAV